MDVLNHPRVRELLAEIHKARMLKARLEPHQDPEGDLDLVVGGLYVDLGRAIHELAAGAPSTTLAGLNDASSSPADLQGESPARDHWYTAEVPIGALFGPGELGDPDNTDIPTSDPLLYVQEELTKDPSVRTLGEIEAIAADPSSGLAALRYVDRPVWAGRLDQLLDRLPLPDRHDPDGLVVEMSRVQWGSDELATKLAGMPETVQLTLLGLLGSRARHLAQHVRPDIGPQMVLERLRQYGTECDLPSVVPLRADGEPEVSDWLTDAHHWWAVLRR